MTWGTQPISTVVTPPNCGACGWDVIATQNLGPDPFCDACGADLRAFGFKGGAAPTDLAAVGGSLSVTFTWTDNPGADSTDFQYDIDGGDNTILTDVASPQVVVAADGEKVDGQVRSVVNGIPGPWSTVASGTATA